MRFSVIMPLFNKAPYVRKALESVVCQSFRDFELIVVDDGSSDDSFLVAKSFLEKENVVHQLLHQDNAGVSTARNNGVAVSHGEYLCFLDADDWWESTFLEKMDKLIRDYPDAGIFGTNYFYVKNERRKVCVTGIHTGYFDYCAAYADTLKMPLWTGAVSVPRVVFDEMGGFRSELTLGEDFDLWIKIALKYKTAFLDEPESFYYQDSDATWRLVGKLHSPKTHMLWNLGYLEDVERTNANYKRLIDGLRTYSLLPYLLSKQYRSEARKELAKVDWSRQPAKIQTLYRMPMWLLNLRQFVLKVGSWAKKKLLKTTSRNLI